MNLGANAVRKKITNETVSKSAALRTVANYASTLILTTLILIWVLRLGLADLAFPWHYSGDGLFGSAVVKGIIQNGWYLYNPFIGAPTGSFLIEYPGTDNLHFFIMKMFSFFTSSQGLIMNLYFLFTFPVTALTSLFAFRQFKLSNSVAMVGAILFTFLPYHFIRGPGHLFLASYYAVPLMVVVIFWVNSKTPLFFVTDDNSKLRFNLMNYRAIVAIVSILIVGSTGVYYAFFAAFFAGIAGLTAYVYRRKFQYIISAFTVIILIVAVMIANLSPTFIYKSQNAKHSELTKRSPVETETFGLKIVQILLPVSGHRIPLLNEFKAKYNQHAPLVTENQAATIGVIGSMGFIILLFWLFFRASLFRKYIDAQRHKFFNTLSILNASAVLYATIGGFGVFLAFLLPEIRALNRISVYIGFFSILAFMIILENLLSLLKKNAKTYLTVLIIGLVLIVGILDQTTDQYIIIDAVSAEHDSDARFIGRIEKLMPDNAKIFQLPYVPFPENPPVNKMNDYDHFRAYFHSNDMQWSYGAIKGREGDGWLRKTSEKSEKELVDTLSIAGFSGIYIDRFGYVDAGNETEKELSKVLNIKQIVSSNARLSFFDLRSYNKAHKLQYSQKEWQALTAEIDADIWQRKKASGSNSSNKNK